ncbi:MAG TPA: DUF3048 domain-containing protein [Nocardioides sp.]|uniref:DUF3048 domain-containing protein n=1 Tax=Nocardioides sp. TaxID=35761 RepID=UPI002E315F1B|nr:DUF3048 domain-containing protein [Nocardioides sp.]HEX3930426.1 DUF3048 domain-containing protein [Nocardioides sp.]
MRRYALTLSAITAAGLMLTACGGSTSSTAESGPQKVEGGQSIQQFWPLTGLKVSSGKTASLDHPVLVAKMDNTVASQPQVGLSKADMVVEELVEGGLTRLAAFYYSEIPGNVGPVRSMRASDIDVVSPVHASMVTSGAAPRTIALIKGAKIPFYGEGSPGMYRSTERAAPYNLFVHLNEIAKATKTKAATPPEYLQFGTGSDLPKGRKVTSIGAQFSGGHTTEWQFENGSYHNLNSNAPAGDQFPATNVLVLRVREGNAGYLDPAGNPVPKTLLTGKGNALLFHDGRMYAATWHKGASASPITLTSKSGQKLEVPAGRTWIELVPQVGGNVTFKK